MSYIFLHYADPLTLDDIAASAGVSRSKCCRLFRKYLGQSPIDFLNSYRLERGRRMLPDTDKSITEIAMSCGFASPGYFTRLFSQKYGVTP